MHGAERRKDGETPASRFRREPVRAAYKGAAGHPKSEAGLTKERPRTRAATAILREDRDPYGPRPAFGGAWAAGGG